MWSRTGDVKEGDPDGSDRCTQLNLVSLSMANQVSSQNTTARDRRIKMANAPRCLMA